MKQGTNKSAKPLCLATIFLSGCGRAPSVDVLGSFFPVWMVCLTIAIILACGLRLVLLRYRLESEIGPVALFYPSVVILLTSLLWLIFFR
jgi:hypothetical protein